jgi:uncharacterized membrane protein YebE (DUF533 family)
MIDTKRLLDQLVGSGVAGGLAGGLAGGALANVLSGKKGRKLAGSALKVGGLALVGGLAYKAWQNYQQGSGQPSPPSPGTVALPPAGSAFLPPEEDRAGTGALSLLLARAMIAAAKADGQVDPTEMDRILGEMDPDEVSERERRFALDELQKPLDVAEIARDVSTPAQAAEVYAASLLAIDIDTDGEREYLRNLAAALRLDPGVVTFLHQTTGAPKV